MKASETLKIAADLTGGDRNSTHGDMVTNHACIASMWQGYLVARDIANKHQPFALTGEDVANMMECLKVARRLTGDYNPDDYVDGAGYAAVAGEIRASN